MTLIDKVRTATSAMHHTFDSALVPYIQAIHSKEDYAALLLLFYGFFKPVYDKIDMHLNTFCLPDYQNRRKPESILNDLKVLGINYTVQLCQNLPPITDNASAFGALYVLEGSTMGGMVIKKMIMDKLGTAEGLTFFNGYGRQTRERWNVFIQSLNKIENITAGETVIQTAAATFVLFKDWLQQSGWNC